MIAITSGLNTPPIRRLKRTWEQVGQRHMAQFAACEATIDSKGNFKEYRRVMQTVNPPCVPFIGLFLVTVIRLNRIYTIFRRVPIHVAIHPGW
jgi:son of sevenless-like protein